MILYHGSKQIVEYTENDSLNYLHFEEMTDKWLDFIVQCRNGKSHNYNTDFYYQPRDYIAACYKKGEVL